MSYRFKEARLQAGLSITEVAKIMGVSQAAASNWDLGKKVPATETLCKLADFYNVSIDYLLGRSDSCDHTQTESILLECSALSCLHGQPVWSPTKGWGIVNAAQGYVIYMDGSTVSFDDAQGLRTLPPGFTIGYHATGTPIPHTDLLHYGEIWVEPIDLEESVRRELRGWYTVKAFYVENEFGNRFYLDAYGNKWLAFQKQSF